MDTIIPCERLRSGAPSAYGSNGFEVVRDGWSIAVFRARRETNARGQLQPSTKDALAAAEADAALFIAAPELLSALNDLTIALSAVLEKPDDETRHHHARYYLEWARTVIAKAEGKS